MNGFRFGRNLSGWHGSSKFSSSRMMTRCYSRMGSGRRFSTYKEKSQRWRQEKDYAGAETMSELAMFLAGLSLGFGLCYWRLEYWRNRAIWAETLEDMRV